MCAGSTPDFTGTTAHGRLLWRFQAHGADGNHNLRTEERDYFSTDSVLQSKTKQKIKSVVQFDHAMAFLCHTLNVRRKDADKPLDENFPSALSVSRTYLPWLKKGLAFLKIDLVKRWEHSIFCHAQLYYKPQLFKQYMCAWIINAYSKINRVKWFSMQITGQILLA